MGSQILQMCLWITLCEMSQVLQKATHEQYDSNINLRIYEYELWNASYVRSKRNLCNSAKYSPVWKVYTYTSYG